MKIPKNYRPFLYSLDEIDSYVESMLSERITPRSRKPRKKLSLDQREEIEDLHGKGFTVREIVKRTGVNKSTVGRIVKGQG